MSKIGQFIKKQNIEEISTMDKYPIIWKAEKCLIGECKNERTTHRWSVPCSAAAGLMTECYDCHKTRLIEIE